MLGDVDAPHDEAITDRQAQFIGMGAVNRYLWSPAHIEPLRLLKIRGLGDRSLGRVKH
jgi:hypothetical protein